MNAGHGPCDVELSDEEEESGFGGVDELVVDVDDHLYDRGEE